MIRVLACGVFDVLHIGHVRHLEKARSLGDHLMVALTLDEHVGKGPGRPVFTWKEREHMLTALRCVDGVMAHYDMQRTLELYRPDIFVKGIEYALDPILSRLCNDLNVPIRCVESKPVYSSTKILNGELLRERIGSVRQSGN